MLIILHDMSPVSVTYIDVLDLYNPFDLLHTHEDLRTRFCESVWVQVEHSRNDQVELKQVLRVQSAATITLPVQHLINVVAEQRTKQLQDNQEVLERGV